MTELLTSDVDFPAESAADAAVTALQADVEFYQKNSDYWHKTYNLLMEQRRRDWSERIDLVAQNDELRSEVEQLRQKHDYLVDALNAISHTVNDAAERQDGGDL